MPLLEISKFSVRYQDSSIQALKDINLSISREELIIVAGTSGCGKSTLAQSILGLIPTFVKAEVLGKIRIQGVTVSELARKDIVQKVGYVPQYPADFITSMLVEEEVAFVLENLAFPPDTIQERIQAVFEQLEITHLQYRLMTELSSGELQRVALAAALAPQPPLLILDEPMARIDPKSEIILANLLYKLKQQGHLVLAFEHRLDYLLPLADRVLILENGRLIGDGEPRSLIEMIKHVDLPEVSELNWNGRANQFLSLNEASDQFLKKFFEIY